MLNKIESVGNGIKLLKENKEAYKNYFDLKQHILTNSEKFVKGLKLIVKELDKQNIRAGVILKVRYLIIILWISLKKGECFGFNHSLGCVYPTLYII